MINELAEQILERNIANQTIKPVTDFEKAEAFDRKHPKVYKLFKEHAYRARQLGYKKYSAYLIVELIRWHGNSPVASRQFKIHNRMRPYYARKFLDDHPEYAGFFDVREAE